MTIEEQEQTGNINEAMAENIQLQFIEAIKAQQPGLGNVRIIRYGVLVFN